MGWPVLRRAEATLSEAQQEEIEKVTAAVARMKVPIDACAAIDLEAPTIAAYRRRTKSGALRYVFHCRHCDAIHSHGAAEGHREAHCTNPASPYLVTGYNLALAENWSK